MAARTVVKVVVGRVWPNVEVQEIGEAEKSDEPEGRTRVAHGLALGAGLLMAAFTGYGMIRGDGALIDRIFNLIEWVVIWLLGWAVGRSHG